MLMFLAHAHAVVAVAAPGVDVVVSVDFVLECSSSGNDNAAAFAVGRPLGCISPAVPWGPQVAYGNVQLMFRMLFLI